MVILTYSVNDIAMAIHSMKPSDGNDISSNILKRNTDLFSPLLTNVINSSFSRGIFFDTLKLARLVPLFKDGNPSLAKNYRPISILPAISKVFERV